MPIAYVHHNDNDAIHFVHQDRLGSVIAVTDQTGTIRESERYAYDPFGNYRTDAAGTGRIPLRYTGRWYDEESGLYYFRARMYSAPLGRFLQVDPIGYEQSVNLYAYGLNSPLNWTDPSGEIFHIAIAIGVSAALEGGIAAGGILLSGGSLFTTAAAAEIASAAAWGAVTGGLDAALPGAGRALGAARTTASVGKSLAKNASGDVGEAGGRGLAKNVGKEAGETGRGADFIVTSDGAAMRPSATDNIAALNEAGLPSTKAKKLEAGRIFTVPNNGTPMEVRIMMGGSGGPPRVVTSLPDTNDFLLPSGRKFPNGTPRSIRRDLSHVELDP